MPRYVFGQSKIWEGANDRVDESLPLRIVKVPKADPEKARRRLPDPEMGRVWVFVGMVDEKGNVNSRL